MPYLDLSTLPPALQASLQQHFDNDESRRRAVLGPNALARFSSILPRGALAWKPSAYWLWDLFDRGWSAKYRRSCEEQFFKTQQLVTQDGVPYVPGQVNVWTSIFDPTEPFFPTPLTEVTRVLRSPWPDVISDAEFWAFTSQMCTGDVREAEQFLSPPGVAAKLRALKKTPWSRLRPFARSAILADAVYRKDMLNRGMYS